MTKLNYFEEFTCKEIIGLLSCFTDIRVREELRMHSPTMVSNPKLQKSLFLLQSIFQEYAEIECKYNLYSGNNYKPTIIYDVIDEMMMWTDMDDEYACKELLQSNVWEQKGISAGDFSKAVLKICVIAKELINVCEQEGWVSLMHKLSLVSKHLLKYICTNQSLYI